MQEMHTTVWKLDELHKSIYNWHFCVELHTKNPAAGYSGILLK